MIIRKYSADDAKRIKQIYKICFSGPPWNQEVTIEETENRWADHSSKPSFECFVAVSDNQIVGASWYDEISRNMLSKERGVKLINFINSIDQNIPLIWIRETIVDPSFQGKGIASQLKNNVMNEIINKYSPAILLTRMRDDNIKIVSANSKLGLQRTGIKVASKATPGLFHEYWYRTLKD